MDVVPLPCRGANLAGFSELYDIELANDGTRDLTTRDLTTRDHSRSPVGHRA